MKGAWMMALCRRLGRYDGKREKDWSAALIFCRKMRTFAG